MAEVHRSKVVSSLEPRPLRRNVTTEFEWEVRSLKEQMVQENRMIYSPFFHVHGTEGARSAFFGDFTGPARTQLGFKWEQPFYVLQLQALEYYIVSVKARVCCGALTEKSAVVESNGYSELNGGKTRILRVSCDSPLGGAIQERNGFSVVVEITTVSAQGELSETLVETGKVVHPMPSLADNLQGALSSGDFTDVVLKSENGDVMPAHRQLLAMRSPVFRAMFYGHMQEAQTGLATIKASSSSLQQLLKCIYTDEIDTGAAELHDFELLELGMQYEVPRLVALVKEQMFRTLTVDNVADRLFLASRYSFEELRRACEAIIKGNLASVMSTDGWARIMNDSVVMGILVNNGRKRESEADLSPRKLKHPRSGM